MKLIKEELFHQGDGFYAELLKQINFAKKSIYFETHYFDDQKLGLELFLSFKKLLKSKCELWIIIDGFCLAKKKLQEWLVELKQLGAHISIFNPPPWLNHTINNYSNINERNHRKLLIIDKKIVFTGSFNIDTRHLSIKKGGENWRDIGVKIQSPFLVNDFISSFWHTWNYSINPVVKTKFQSQSGTIYSNYSSHTRKKFYQQLISRIERAKNCIWISNPYFTPQRSIVKALTKASLKGIEVKILLPQKSDHDFFPLVNYMYYQELLIKSNIQFFEYLPDILHAKIFKIDQWVLIGSSNLNSRSQKHDWELNYQLQTQQAIDEIQERFKTDLNHSQNITLKTSQKKYDKEIWKKIFYKGIDYWL